MGRPLLWMTMFRDFGGLYREAVLVARTAAKASAPAAAPTVSLSLRRLKKIPLVTTTKDRFPHVLFR
jgi:hypothetical protein